MGRPLVNFSYKKDGNMFLSVTGGEKLWTFLSGTQLFYQCSQGYHLSKYSSVNVTGHPNTNLGSPFNPPASSE